MTTGATDSPPAVPSAISEMTNASTRSRKISGRTPKKVAVGRTNPTTGQVMMNPVTIRFPKKLMAAAVPLSPLL